MCDKDVSFKVGFQDKVMTFIIYSHEKQSNDR